MYIARCLNMLLNNRKQISKNFVWTFQSTTNLCNNIKIIPHTCKSKLCSSCGKKATAIWIAKQNNILPNTEWQHITFTMPSELWDLFWLNRDLLNQMCPSGKPA